MPRKMEIVVLFFLKAFSASTWTFASFSSHIFCFNFSNSGSYESSSTNFSNWLQFEYIKLYRSSTKTFDSDNSSRNLSTSDVRVLMSSSTSEGNINSAIFTSNSSCDVSFLDFQRRIVFSFMYVYENNNITTIQVQRVK